MNEQLKRWCKDRSHLLIFLGALIVFITFIVKEGLRERWQHNAEVIDSAQSAYALRAEIGVLNKKIEGLIKRSDAPQTFTTKPGSGPINLETDANVAKVRLTTISDFLQGVDDELVHTRILAEVLPKTDPNRQETEQMIKTIETLHQKLYDVNRILSDLSLQEMRKTDTPSVRENLGKQANELETNTFHSVITASEEMNQLRKKVFDDAQSTRERKEIEADIAWWSTATLFAIGWGLGLLGKLYGVPEAAGAE
jgi:hypothetical protein